MNAQKLRSLLKHLGACSESRGWSRGKTLEEAWAECHNGEWMDWFWKAITVGPPAEWVAVEYEPEPLVFDATGCATSCTGGIMILHRTQITHNAEAIRTGVSIKKLQKNASATLKKLQEA